MRESNHGLIDFLSSRRELATIIVSGVVLALGIEFLASELTELAEGNSYVRIIIGVILILLSLTGIGASVVRARKFKVEISTSLLYDTKDSALMIMPGFQLSEQVEAALSAAIVESGAIRKTWSDEPLFKPSQPAGVKSNSNDTQVNSNSAIDKNKVRYSFIVKKTIGSDHVGGNLVSRRSIKLVREAVEYSVLKELSHHLSSYFTNLDEPAFLQQYSRSDIPHILLENRILSLLCTPMEERETFMELAKKNQLPDGEIVGAFGSDGSRYDKFELSLPIGSKISRPTPTRLLIDSPRVQLVIATKVPGFATNVSPDYIALVLSRSPRSVWPFIVQIEISAFVKLQALLSPTGWEHYRWLDSFVQRLSSFASIDAYFERVRWDSVLLGHTLSTTLHLARPDFQKLNALIAKSSAEPSRSPKADPIESPKEDDGN